MPEPRPADHPPRAWTSALRGAVIALAVVLFAWRYAIDGDHSSPKELRQAALDSLLLVVAANTALGIDAARFARARWRTLVGLLLPLLAYAALLTYHGLAARRHLACEARVVDAAAAAGASAPLQARMACFSDD
jgi:hypothetical protein